jgi:plastocyanin
MRNRNRLWVFSGLTMVLVVLAAACGGGDSTTASGPGSGSATATTVAESAAKSSDEAYVEIKNFTFTAPKSVKAGSKVEVRNGDSTAHTVTADDGSFDTKDVGANGEASFTAPSTAGTYKFHCSIHSSMTSELVVTA